MNLKNINEKNPCPNTIKGHDCEYIYLHQSIVKRWCCVRNEECISPMKKTDCIFYQVFQDYKQIMEMLKYDCNYCINNGCDPDDEPCGDCHERKNFKFNERKLDILRKNKTYKMKITDPQYDMCPICNIKGELISKSLIADMKCKNGHEWHYCHIHQCKVLGKEEPKKDAFKDCMCYSPKGDK